MNEDIQARLLELQAELHDISDPTEREMRLVYIQAATTAIELLGVVNQAEFEHEVSRPVSALVAAVALLVNSTTDFRDLEVTAHQLLDAVLRDYKRAYGQHDNSH